MIGGLSRSATQALRQLLDAGTLANLPAGFKSRGIRIRDDDQPFQPRSNSEMLMRQAEILKISFKFYLLKSQVELYFNF